MTRHVVLKEKNQMSGIDLNDEDVVSMSKLEAFDAGDMFKFVQLKRAIESFLQGDGNSGKYVNPRVKWVKDGVRCEVLRVKGDGWQKGKLRLYMEFIPDDPEAFQQKTTTEVNGSKSDVDDLRDQILGLTEFK